MDFSLMQGQANIEPVNYSLELEKTRYDTLDKQWRLQHLTRVKVRRLFNQPVGGYGVSLTTYYEVFAYAEYKKHLNVLRDYFVSQFNEQIMTRIQEKNNFAKSLIIKYQGFTTNEQIDDAFLRYSKGKLNVDEFVATVKDRYDTNTF